MIWRCMHVTLQLLGADAYAVVLLNGGACDVWIKEGKCGVFFHIFS